MWPLPPPGVGCSLGWRAGGAREGKRLVEASPRPPDLPPGRDAGPGCRGEFGIRTGECPQGGGASPRQARGAAFRCPILAALGTWATVRARLQPPLALALPAQAGIDCRIKINFSSASAQQLCGLSQEHPVSDCTEPTLPCYARAQSPPTGTVYPAGASSAPSTPAHSAGRVALPRTRAGGAGTEDGLQPLPTQGSCPQPAGRQISVACGSGTGCRAHSMRLGVD